MQATTTGTVYNGDTLRAELFYAIHPNRMAIG
jgi:hypothetical protein